VSKELLAPLPNEWLAESLPLFLSAQASEHLMGEAAIRWACQFGWYSGAALQSIQAEATPQSAAAEAADGQKGQMVLRHYF
jgi:hypothetical protein